MTAKLMEALQNGDKKDKLMVTVNLGTVSITVKGYNKEELQRLLEQGIDLADQNKERIKALAAGFPFAGSNNPSIDERQLRSPAGTTINSDISIPGIDKIVKVFEDGSIEFTANKIFELKAYEVIAIIMFALNKPLGPAEIASIITGAWKAVSNDSVSTYFSRELKAKVKKDSGKYTLNGAGKNWVEQELLQKCL